MYRLPFKSSVTSTGNLKYLSPDPGLFLFPATVIPDVAPLAHFYMIMRIGNKNIPILIYIYSHGQTQLR